MLTVGILDANERASKGHENVDGSLVAGWLVWEAKNAGVELVPPGQADVVLAVHSGAIDWVQNVKKHLRRAEIDLDPGERNRRPYVIAGGPIDTCPMTALALADALAVGEAFNFTRGLFDLIMDGYSVDAVAGWVEEYQHAIERGQTSELTRDGESPWLFSEEPPTLATPDTWIDWDMPPIRGDDKVVRVIGSKGCHRRCAFCVTSYRQPYQQDHNSDRVARKVRSLSAKGERVQLLSNDPAHLDYWARVSSRLDSQSFTVSELKKPQNRAALLKAGVGMVRMGVEGMSERLRRACRKPVKNEELLAMLADFNDHKTKSHMFFIVGLPFETEDDWEEYRQFHARLVGVLDYGICRIKYTAYNPSPPAPLGRFATGGTYARREAETKLWVQRNASTKNVLAIRPRMPETHGREVSELLSVDKSVGEWIMEQEVVDLAPTLGDMRRMTCEIVDWPVDIETRYATSERYRERVT